MDISRIKHPEVKRFLTVFLSDRQINKEIFNRIPEDKFDFRMVDTPARRSDSPRESIVHLIYITRNHVHSIKTGILEWSNAAHLELMDGRDRTKSKEKLIGLLDQTEHALIEALSDRSFEAQRIKVDWSSHPVPALMSLWSLDRHEILHQGWNLAIIDHLGIDRFPELKQMWG